MSENKEKTVLYFQTSFCDSNLQQRLGLYDFARKAGWFVHVIEYGSQVSKKPKPDMAELFGFWNPDGCVVDCGGADVILTLEDFRAVPTVFIDKYLDVILTPEGDVKVDDRDELDAAYASGDLTKAQYEAALAEGEAILRAYLSKATGRASSGTGCCR